MGNASDRGKVTEIKDLPFALDAVVIRKRSPSNTFHHAQWYALLGRRGLEGISLIAHILHGLVLQRVNDYGRARRQNVLQVLLLLQMQLTGGRGVVWQERRFALVTLVIPCRGVEDILNA